MKAELSGELNLDTMEFKRPTVRPEKDEPDEKDEKDAKDESDEPDADLEPGFLGGPSPFRTSETADESPLGPDEDEGSMELDVNVDLSSHFDDAFHYVV